MCPEHITITDNAIIPLKERVVDEFFDPIGKLVKIFSRKREAQRSMILKPISQEGIPAALQKAERYRLINDPSAAESICLDVLEVDPENQTALVVLILSITDQFVDELGDGVSRARELLPRLTDEYKRAYYEGIICERRARAQLRAARRAPPRWRPTGSAKRWRTTSAPSACGRRGTTRRSCAGTPARGCSVATSGAHVVRRVRAGARGLIERSFGPHSGPA